MKCIRKWLFGNNTNLLKRSTLWNMISSIEYSIQSAILLLIVTRIGGAEEAGIFTIAYTLTQMMATIGSYGMRGFQASDIKKEFAFSVYFSSRLVSTLSMIIICFIYAKVHLYTGEKMYLIIFLCGYRVLEDIEDVFHGEMQKEQRLDVASKIVAVRICIATFIFGIVYYVSHDLIESTIIFVCSAFFISFFLNMIAIPQFSEICYRVSGKHVKKLLWICFPVCLNGYFYNYLVNAPKYAIDRQLTENEQTIFNILFMPIFTINMLSNIVFKPQITNMGIYWNEHNKKKFIIIIIKQLFIIIGMTICLMIFGDIIGLKLLELIYKVELDKYKSTFILLLMFGGFAAMVAFLVVVLTVTRKQQYILYCYGFTAIAASLLIDTVVAQYGITGAAMAYGGAMLFINIILIIILVYTIIRSGRDAEIVTKNL